MVAGLTKNDSDLIGFVVACLFHQAISRDDLHDWCVRLISENDAANLPPYIFDLLDYEGALAKVFSVIGFVPRGVSEDSEKLALDGIAVARGVMPYELRISPAEALEHLRLKPNIQERFRATFPNITLQLP